MVVVFGNVTNSTISWEPEPPGRGTWSILSSCIITISLCAWTALHLNVPKHGAADRQWLRKAKWLGLGLAAPEMVVYVAWCQRQQARRLVRDVRRRGGSEERRSKVASTLDSSTTAPGRDQMRLRNWTLTHGFYAIMGGFAFDSSNAGEPFLPESRTRAAVTASGIRFLLEHEADLLPAITKAEIQDKSKADGLKKFLVCIQASWFCASCISRLASSLPISLLELNAMAHALCALLIYTMWWHKPLDIAEPTLIRSRQAQSLFAFMWMSSRIGAEGIKSHDFHGRVRDEFDALWIYRQPRFEDLIFEDSRSSDGEVEGRDDDSNVIDSQTAKQVEEGMDPQIYSRSHRHYSSAAPLALRYQLINWAHSKEFPAWFGVRFPAGLGVRKCGIDHVSQADITRWRLSHEAIRKYHLEEDVNSRHAKRSYTYDRDSRVTSRIGNLLSLRASKPFEVWFGFAVAGLLYGGLHLVAWNAPFASEAEEILWRVAASSVTATPFVLFPISLVFGSGSLRQGSEDLTVMLRRSKIERTDGLVLYWARMTAVILAVPFVMVSPLLWFAYVLGRLYLVVECFKNVVNLPKGAFETQSWSMYFPHII